MKYFSIKKLFTYSVEVVGEFNYNFRVLLSRNYRFNRAKNIGR